MNNITIEFCKEDRGRIDNLIVELAGLRHALTAGQVTAIQLEPQEAETQEQPLPPVEEQKAEEPKTEAPKQAAPEPAPAPAPEAPVVTVAELQARVVQLVNAGKKAETREIILKYAQNVGSIPEDKRAEVLGLLNGLEG